MRTTLDLPEDLVDEARRLTNSRSKRETVITALEELVRDRLRQRLIGRLGKTRLNLTREDVREMRKSREPPPKGSPLVVIAPAEGRHRCPPKFIPDWDEDDPS